jgi:hypothetical protein
MAKHAEQRAEVVKNSYMRGFLSGLEAKFEEQFTQLKQEYGLMVLIPKEVEEELSNITTEKPLTLKLPPIEEMLAYEKGFIDGKKIDYTRSTIDEKSD